MKYATPLLLMLALAPTAAGDATLVLVNEAKGPVHYRFATVEGVARIDLEASAREGHAQIVPGTEVRFQTTAGEWAVGVAGGLVETLVPAREGDPVRTTVRSIDVQGLPFVEVSVERGGELVARQVVYLVLDGEDAGRGEPTTDELLERRERLEREVFRREVALDIARLEARLRWIDGQEAWLYQAMPGTYPYLGPGPVYGFTQTYYGPFGYGYGIEGQGSYCPWYSGGLGLGFFYRGDNWFLGFGTHMR